METKKERRVYEWFEIGVAAKGAFAALELLGGLAALVVAPSLIVRVAIFVTRGELGHDPDDFLANHLLSYAHAYAIGPHLFVALYLMSHGVVKLGLIAALFAGRLWAYPASIIVFSAFAAYQLYLYVAHGSLLILALTALDIVVIWLIWREWRVMRSRAP